MLVAQFFILLAHLRDFALVERKPQGIERRPPQPALAHGAAEHGQRVRLVAGIAGALIGDVGRGRSALEQEGPFARGRRLDLENGAGEPQPVAAVLRGGGGDLAENLQAGAEIVAPEGGVGIGFQGRGRFGDRARLALDLGLQLDRGIGEIVAFEGLVRRLCRNQAKRQRGAECCGANQTDHDGAPGAADERRLLQRSAPKGDGLMAAEQTGKKVACDICRKPALGRPHRQDRGAASRCRANRTVHRLRLSRPAGETGSVRTWRQSGFFIMAMI